MLGNANCATGAAGHAAAVRTVAETAKRLGCKPEEVFVCSTGVIGSSAGPGQKFCALCPCWPAIAVPLPRSFAEVSLAICTTDTRPKTAAASFKMAGETNPPGRMRQRRGHDPPQHGDHAGLCHHRCDYCAFATAKDAQGSDRANVQTPSVSTATPRRTMPFWVLANGEAGAPAIKKRKQSAS